jgi:hypothetical protein
VLEGVQRFVDTETLTQFHRSSVTLSERKRLSRHFRSHLSLSLSLSRLAITFIDSGLAFRCHTFSSLALPLSTRQSLPNKQVKGNPNSVGSTSGPVVQLPPRNKRPLHFVRPCLNCILCESSTHNVQERPLLRLIFHRK